MFIMRLCHYCYTRNRTYASVKTLQFKSRREAFWEKTEIISLLKVYLLSEIHVRVYNSRHINRESLISADNGGVSVEHADGNRMRRLRTPAKIPFITYHKSNKYCISDRNWEYETTSGLRPAKCGVRVEARAGCMIICCWSGLSHTSWGGDRWEWGRRGMMTGRGKPKNSE
jgi:hypothetical protein